MPSVPAVVAGGSTAEADPFAVVSGLVPEAEVLRSLPVEVLALDLLVDSGSLEEAGVSEERPLKLSLAVAGLFERFSLLVSEGEEVVCPSGSAIGVSVQSSLSLSVRHLQSPTYLLQEAGTFLDQPPCWSFASPRRLGCEAIPLRF